MNPLTGSAEKRDVTSSTVIAPTCGLADAYATSFMALGFEKSKELLKNLPNIEAFGHKNYSLNNHTVFVTLGVIKSISH